MAPPSRPAADAGISIGQVFLEKYRVDAILGHGGMGVVAKCTHLGLNELVALKMLRQDVLLDRDATERFMREAQAASKLRSEYVARVVDVGTFHDSGVPYMVMEFLDGHDLGELLEQRGTIPAPWASMLMLQAAEALAEAHSLSIVHRDVKPSNLFVTWRPDGTAIIKVLDFGISKAPMGTDMQLTQTQSLLGTPAYMSPEQMRSARLVDARTDIWSLGTVLYELLEGHRPFEADSFSEMCVKVAVDQPEPMVKTSPALQQVVLRCLAKSPDQRYSNMAELGRDLIPFAQDGHGATLLVERMQRVLGRRSHIDWEHGNGTNGGRPATPLPVRDFASAPVHVPRLDSSPVIPQQAITATPAHGVPTYAHQRDSAPARAPSEAMVAPRRRLPWMIVFALVFAAVGIAIGLWVGLPSDEDRAAATNDERPAIDPKVEAAKAEAVKLEAAKLEAAKLEAAKAEAAKLEADKLKADLAAQAAEIEMAVDPVGKPPTKPSKVIKKHLTVKTKAKDPKQEPAKDPTKDKPVGGCKPEERIRPDAPCPTKSN